jgi:hypothetical protein
MRRADREAQAKKSREILTDLSPFLKTVELMGWKVKVFPPTAYYLGLAIKISRLSPRNTRAFIQVIRDKKLEEDLIVQIHVGRLRGSYKTSADDAPELIKEKMRELYKDLVR